MEPQKTPQPHPAISAVTDRSVALLNILKRLILIEQEFPIQQKAELTALVEAVIVGLYQVQHLSIGLIEVQKVTEILNRIEQQAKAATPHDAINQQIVKDFPAQKAEPIIETRAVPPEKKPLRFHPLPKSPVQMELDELMRLGVVRDRFNSRPFGLEPIPNDSSQTIHPLLSNVDSSWPSGYYSNAGQFLLVLPSYILLYEDEVGEESYIPDSALPLVFINRTGTDQLGRRAVSIQDPIAAGKVLAELKEWLGMTVIA